MPSFRFINKDGVSGDYIIPPAYMEALLGSNQKDDQVEPAALSFFTGPQDHPCVRCRRALRHSANIDRLQVRWQGSTVLMCTVCQAATGATPQPQS